MAKLFTTREAHELLDIPATTLKWWVRHGAFQPAVPGRGRGTSMVLSLQQVWAIGIAKSIRNGGQTLEVACEVATFLESLPPKEVETAFNEKRSCVLIVGVDDQMNVCPRLLSPEAITDNPELKKLRKQAARDGQTLKFFGLDVKPMLDQLTKAIEGKK